jgi:hypothetical protein
MNVVTPPSQSPAGPYDTQQGRTHELRYRPAVDRRRNDSTAASLIQGG